jgi:2'-5' RNA ligase
MTKKLFLGISLDEQQRQEIRQLQDNFDVDVRLVPITNLHMTLAFFGPVSNKIQRKLEKGISALHKPKFCVTLNQLAHWKKPKILCLTGESKDKALQQLAKDCQLLTAALDLPSSEHVFTAHITVARKAHQIPKTSADRLHFEPVILRPEAIHLFESRSGEKGVEYRILRSWPLH